MLICVTCSYNIPKLSESCWSSSSRGSLSWPGYQQCLKENYSFFLPSTGRDLYTALCLLAWGLSNTRSGESSRGVDTNTPTLLVRVWKKCDNCDHFCFKESVYLLLTWQWPLACLAVEPWLQCDTSFMFPFNFWDVQVSFFSQRQTIPYSSSSYSASDSYNSGRSEAPELRSWHSIAGLWLVSSSQCSALIGHCHSS